MGDLKTYIDKKGISQADFARLIKVDPSALSRYLSGKRLPPPQVAIRIQNATQGFVSFQHWYN